MRGAVYEMLDSFATARAATHMGEMCPHEQRCRPPPLGGESEGGINGKGRLLGSKCGSCRTAAHSSYNLSIQELILTPPLVCALPRV